MAAVESDLTNRSVGLGGRPDRDGHVTLDACIQDHAGRAGAVAFVWIIQAPISIAGRHGKDAARDARGGGAERWSPGERLHPEEVDLPGAQAWQEWLKTATTSPW